MSILTNQLGLSISESKIQLVEIVNKENSVYLENVDEEYFEELIDIYTKEAKFIHILQNAFNEIILRKPVSSSKISIGLPPHYFKIFELPVDKNLTKNDVNDYIKWEISKLFPSYNSTFSFQKIILNTPNYEQYRKMLVFAIEQNFLKRIHKFCVRNNLKLQFVDNVHIASVALLTEKNSAKNILSVFVEDDHISSLLLSNGNLLFESNDKYKTIPEISKIINELAEQIKTYKIVKSIDDIVLWGNSVTQELCNEINSITEINVERTNPFSNIKLSNRMNESKYVNDLPEKFAAPAAISFRIGS